MKLTVIVNAISLTFRWPGGTEIFYPDSIYLTKVFLFNFWILPVHLMSILSQTPSESFRIKNSRFTIKIFKLCPSRPIFQTDWDIVQFELENRDQPESENGKYRAWKVAARFIARESIEQSLRQFVIALTIHVSPDKSSTENRAENNEIGRLERVKNTVTTVSFYRRIIAWRPAAWLRCKSFDSQSSE